MKYPEVECSIALRKSAQPDVAFCSFKPNGYKGKSFTPFFSLIIIFVSDVTNLN